MLFNSYEFIFLYLPITLGGFFVIAKLSNRAAALWLVVASLAFYAWWNPRMVGLLLGSIAFNYLAGLAINQASSRNMARLLLFGAVASNLMILAVFKYANFFISTVNFTPGMHIQPVDIVLPLGISFFTFTQIAFLVDVCDGVVAEYDPIHYLLFVSYFPHLIAGPVLHHRQMMPQFALPETYRLNYENLTLGAVLFGIGLAKKVLLADSLSAFVGPTFDAAEAGSHPTLLVAWAAALAYSFQIYFDFSGYSDMALGLARMMGVTLPINFDSPYKARNIIDFWRRWHITLSVFLRDYLYFRLGGNRKGTVRRYLNLLTTMLLGGLWHGASWTFLAWGGIHGLYLVGNHAWRAMRPAGNAAARGAVRDACAIALTFGAVTVAWVFFRARSFHAAFDLVGSMIGLNGIALPGRLEALVARILAPFGLAPSPWFEDPAVSHRAVLLLAIAGLIAWLPPSSNEIVGDLARHLGGVPPRRPIAAAGMAMAVGALLYFAVAQLGAPSEFLYFQF